MLLRITRITILIVGLNVWGHAQAAKPKAQTKPATRTAKAKPKAKPAVAQAKPATPVLTKTLYENNFEKASPGKPPQELLVLGGKFEVVKDGANTVIELPGDPLDTFGLLFGPNQNADAGVSARINGEAKGRRSPGFAVGLFGVSGYKLRVSAGNGTIDVVRDEEVKGTVPYNWKSGTWTWLRLQATKLKSGNWKVEGKAWPQGAKEPQKWMISVEDKEAPPSGRASIMGIPYSSTPIRFDDLKVSGP